MHRRQFVFLSSATEVAALLSTTALATGVSPEEAMQQSAAALSNGNVIYQMLQDVSDSGGHPELVFKLDEMIDNVMLYWLPNAGPSSARLYWETAREKPRLVTIDEPMPLPTGVSMFPGEKARISKRWAASRFAKLVHFNELPKGGHLAAWEQPVAFVDEVRTTFREVRK